MVLIEKLIIPFAVILIHWFHLCKVLLQPLPSKIMSVLDNSSRSYIHSCHIREAQNPTRWSDQSRTECPQTIRHNLSRFRARYLTFC